MYPDILCFHVEALPKHVHVGTWVHRAMDLIGLSSSLGVCKMALVFVTSKLPLNSLNYGIYGFSVKRSSCSIACRSLRGVLRPVVPA